MNKSRFAGFSLLALSFLFGIQNTKAQEVGEYGFLEIPVSARAAALGVSAISVVEPEVALVDQNPALLSPEMANQVAISYINYVSDINLGYAAFAGKFHEYGAWAGAVRYVDYGSFARYDENGTPAGTFSAKDIAFSGSVSYPVNDRLNIGGTIRGIYSHYEAYGAFAFGADIGLNYYNPDIGRSLSLVVTNLGGQIERLYEKYQHLPTQIAMGFSKEVEHLPLCVSVSAIRLLDRDTDFIKHFVVGAEWLITDQIYFAAGYNFRHLSAGGGFKFRQWNFQLAYARYNRLDGSLNLGISYQR